MADFVLRNARLVELGPGRWQQSTPRAPRQHARDSAHWAGPVDLVVEGGHVLEVGHDLPRPAGLPAYDADGRWLIPGLWDQHVHLGQWTAMRDRLDLAGATSPDEVIATVRRKAHGRTRPLVAWGHRTGLWDREPTVAELDAVAPDLPVFLISGDGHHAWLNTRALDALGLARRDEVVTENEWFDSYARLAEIAPPDLSDAAYAVTLDAAAALGIVGIVDLEFAETPATWATRPTPLRIRASTYADGLDRVIADGLRTGDAIAPHVTMGPLKIISDGSLNTRTAWCCEEYADGGHGAPNQTVDELVELLDRAHQHGLEVATHAIGDRAVANALDAYDRTGASGSIEHAQLLDRHDSRRLAQLGLRASVQPAHLLDDRDVTELAWPDRADRCFAFRWMVDDGVDLRFGSDAPVSPLDPWLAIAAAVHRSADDRPAWHPEQALTPREALAASVDGLGTVHAGMPADLVLLEHDPLAPGRTDEQAARLRDLPVSCTLVAGETAYGDLGPLVD